VPDALFDRRVMQHVLKEFYKNEKSNSYYRAILQNLFFATLNQAMDKRGFVKEGTFPENRNNYGVKNLYRYAADFAVDEKKRWRCSKTYLFSTVASSIVWIRKTMKTRSFMVMDFPGI